MYESGPSEAQGRLGYFWTAYARSEADSVDLFFFNVGIWISSYYPKSNGYPVRSELGCRKIYRRQFPARRYYP